MMTNYEEPFKKHFNVIIKAQYCYPKGQKGEITVKGPKCTKVKVLFQGLHMTCVIFVLVYNLKFYNLETPFNIAFKIYLYFDYKLI